MFGTTDLALFVVSGLLLNVAPGPDTLYILGRSSTQGWPAGAAAALGIGAGCLVHVLGAALGLSALLIASASAFVFLKWAGAAYLVWLGIELLRSGDPTPGADAPGNTASLPRATYRHIFAQGFLTNVLNPKVAFFFLAFLPQFVDPSAPNKAFAFLFLGLVFDLNGTLWNLLVAWTAARASTRIGPRLRLWVNRTLGGLLVVIGVRLATSRLG